MDLEDLFNIIESESKACPGFIQKPQQICIVGSSTGTYDSIYKLISCGFKNRDRIILLTPWESYAIFQGQKEIFLFRDVLNSVDRIRHLDVSVGSYGLLNFKSIPDCVNWILFGNDQCFRVKIDINEAVEQILSQI